MLTFDASSIVYGWDNYPADMLPPLWAWLAREVQAQRMQISYVAAEEVGHVSPECGRWMAAVGVRVLPVSNPVSVEANRIKGLPGVAGDAHHPNGVDENDLLIIATARTQGCGLVSNESVQLNLPLAMPRYKIPVVCGLDSVGVRCMSFIDYRKSSGQVFGA